MKSQPKEPKSLYFVAVTAPEPIQSQLTEMKQTAKERFDAGHALNAPAHMTLIPPFRATENEVKSFARDLKDFLTHQKLTPLSLSGFDHFGNRVIFVDVEKNPDWHHLQKELYRIFQKHFPRQAKTNRFHPHFTIAFRDLQPAIFPEAWKYFSHLPYQASFQPSGVDILRHRNKRWHIIERIKGKAEN